MIWVYQAEYLSEQHHYDHIMMNDLLTQWGGHKMAAIFQTTFSYMKMYEFRLRFHWSVFPRVKFTIFHHWFRWWLGDDQATSHYLNQWWLVYWHIYASLGLNGLKIGDINLSFRIYFTTIWRSFYLNNIWFCTHIFISRHDIWLKVFPVDPNNHRYGLCPGWLGQP